MMRDHGGKISTRETPDSSIRALKKFYHQSHLVAKQGEFAKEIIHFALQNISFTLQRDL
jgi:hypothetical protein